ncbi:ABC transporter ATP-binding protein [Ahrensia sp. R2A130]|uniref:ABC transporter ATP-binding protein n=1 Tax=Ahrensia sp. R2A130 TaxID=744979 RepID=UPI0001E09C15|nr:ABC transporter ATP-binding protein [Ahrensia sp. R2A130]EFL90612.1 aliphatic sulfonates import ATP-binding protein SsuB 1 [Ahrensia sp. R2A130]
MDDFNNPSAHAPAPAVELRDVSLRYDNGVEALHDCSLQVSVGERVALLGPSGCGKSSILRIVAGLQDATIGEVQVAADSEVGFVFQEATLLPWATITKNVAMPLSLHGKPDTNKRVAEALAEVGLSEFASAYPRELSGGMAMRASIARALVTEPDIMLMDEPFGALDEITRFRLNDLLLERHTCDPHTLLFVTHSVFEAVYLADRVLVMSPRPGRIVADIDVLQKVRDAAWRGSTDYAAICNAVSQALEQAMTAA